MKRILLSLLPMFLVLTSALPSSHAEETVFKLRYSTHFPPTHKISVLSEQWCKEVEKRTDGRVKISYFPGGTLTPAAQTYDSVIKGIADIGQSVTAYTPGRFPLCEVTDLPLGFRSADQATNMANAFYKKFRPKEFDDTKVCYLYTHGPGYFHTKKEIAKIDDLKGLRIKAAGTTAKIASAVGAIPVTLPMGETYDALQKGLVEGILLPVEALKGWKFGEQVKYTLENYSASYTAAFFVVMNRKKWEGFPPDIQQTIEKINEEWMQKVGKLMDELDEDARGSIVSKGHKIVSSSKADEDRAAQMMKPLFEEYVKSMNGQGLPGDEALKFCFDYLKSLRKP